MDGRKAVRAGILPGARLAGRRHGLWMKSLAVGRCQQPRKTGAFSFFRQTPQRAGHNGLRKGTGKFATHHVTRVVQRGNKPGF